jgi:hypothetical protein
MAEKVDMLDDDSSSSAVHGGDGGGGGEEDEEELGARGSSVPQRHRCHSILWTILHAGNVTFSLAAYYMLITTTNSHPVYTLLVLISPRICMHGGYS